MPYDVLDRLEREIDELGRRGLGPEDWCRAADQLLRRVVPFDSSCWQTNDPTTSLITGHVTLNLPTLPDGFALVAANEYLAEDVNRFADLARAPVPVGVLSQATEGRPERSMRWREYLRPGGLDHELRIALIDRGQCWGPVMLLAGAAGPTSTRRSSKPSGGSIPRWRGVFAARSCPPRRGTTAHRRRG